MSEVLITDDDPVVRMILGMILKGKGFTVLEAETATACLDLFSERTDSPPVLMFLDFQLPDMSGPEVLDKVREIVPTSKMPIVMLSANSEDDVRDMFLTHRPDHYLEKPFTAATVNEVLEKLGLA